MLFNFFLSLMLFVETCIITKSTREELGKHGGLLKIDDSVARQIISWHSREVVTLCKRRSNTRWNFQTNIQESTKKQSVEAAVKYSDFMREVWKNISNYDWKSLTNETMKRQFFMLSNIGTNALSSEKSIILKNVQANMTDIYASTKICRYKNTTDCSLNLDPEITEILSNSRDYNELEYYWKEWHEKVGRPCKPYYKQFVDLANEAAKLNGENDMSDIYKFPYESATLEEDVAQLWNQLKPLYRQLHAYVRKKLIAQYGADKVSRTGPIPAHLLGNMWSQQWGDVANFTMPFNNTSEISIDPELQKQNYSASRMFRTAEAFFVGLGMKAMPASFWENTIMERPKDGRKIVCHASAWDFCDGKDVRIKMCTKIDQNDFITIHHEMGHVEYFLYYKDQPITFRGSANPGFHEAIGDVIALSVSTTKHLQSLNLIPPEETSKEAEINFLYKMALDKIAFLPFGYVMDYYRWRVFRDEIKEHSWNSEWWRMRKEYQGIVPPVGRSEEDFDPAAKYHIPADVEYLRYFISFVIQFQFHKGLCTTAGQYDPKDPSKPLHHCDINKSTAAGKQFASILRLGSSVKWPEVLKIVTGEERMNAQPILDYFAPLFEFLETDNRKTGEILGWAD